MYITINWVRTTTSFKLVIEILSIRKTLVFDHCDKLAFSLDKKFTDDVIFSHADTLTGCALDANIIKFRAYWRLICCYPPHTSRETWVMSMAFSSSMKFFFRMHQACMWSCSPDLLLMPGLLLPHPSAVAYFNTLKGTSQVLTREPYVHVCVWCLLFSARPCFKEYA